MSAIIFIFVHYNLVEKKKSEKHSNIKESHTDTYMDYYRIRHKNGGKQNYTESNNVVAIHNKLTNHNDRTIQ